jgi:hypothetical protein
MKPTALLAAPRSTKTPRFTAALRRPGTYLACPACGRLLNIEWATRSIVCSCGHRIPPPKDK